MNLRSLIWGSEKSFEEHREKSRALTNRQIEEAKAAVAEVGVLKELLVSRANGALYQLRKGARGNGKGDTEEKL